MKLLQVNFLAFLGLSLSLHSQGQEKLKDVTFGFAAGFSQNLERVYDYSLSQSNFSLHRQALNRGAFVVSSMISIKLTPLETDPGTNQLRTQKASGKNTLAKPKERFALNVGLNLMEVSNSVKFNKSVDGGIGLGYYLQKNSQIALMFEASSVRQVRESIEQEFLGKPIPKSGDVLNALDRNDDNLFYNRFVTGLSLKIVFSL